jgi:2-oxoglutarate ferredoxin oxidoreductase subunit beta
MERTLTAGKPRLWNRDIGRFPYCPGCQTPILERLLSEAIDELGIEHNTIGVTGVGCHARVCVPIDIDAVQSIHGRAIDVATGIKRALDGTPIVFTVQGDGDCSSIGGGALLGACSRCEKITIIMLNNNNYGTTGGQMAPTTLMGQVTTTTPEGRTPEYGYPLQIPEFLAHMKSVCYAARGALTTFAQYQRTKRYIKKALSKQMNNIGLSFVEVLVACPTNWRMTPRQAIKWIQNEVIPEFPLREYKDVNELS